MDAVQSVLLFVGIISLLVKSSLMVGGYAEVMKRMEQDGRNNILQ